jgi:hypothetical protein
VAKIEYDIAFDDLLAFQVFHFQRFNKSQKQKVIRSIVLGSVICVLTFMWAVYRGFDTISIVLFTIPTVALFFVVLSLLLMNERIIRSRLRKIINVGNENDTRGIICKHVITITPDEFIETTEVNEDKRKWSGISNIVENDKYIFIYISANTAHIIPKRAFASDAAITSFVKTAKQYSGIEMQFKEEMVCDSCGQILPENANVCPNCGVEPI